MALHCGEKLRIFCNAWYAFCFTQCLLTASYRLIFGTRNQAFYLFLPWTLRYSPLQDSVGRQINWERKGRALSRRKEYPSIPSSDYGIAVSWAGNKLQPWHPSVERGKEPLAMAGRWNVSRATILNTCSIIDNQTCSNINSSFVKVLHPSCQSHWQSSRIVTAVTQLASHLWLLSRTVQDN